MSDDSNNMAAEAQAEAIELDPPKAERRGYESLRGVRRSVYFRRSLLRMLSLAPEALDTYRPKNGFETVARNMILASAAKDRSAAVAVAVFRECQSALGEKVSLTSRPTTEERQRQMPTVVADLPWKDYSRPQNADDEKAN